VRIDTDAWLSGIFGHAVYRVEPKAAAGEITDSLRQHLAGRSDRAMYYAKVDTRDVRTAQALAAAGMSVVDVNVTLGAAPHTAVPDAPGVRVDDCSAADAPAVLDIAGSAFRYSRFHLDPDVPTELAHRIKREWIANYVSKARGEALLVAHLAGRPAGFLAVIGGMQGERRVRTIDLVAVDERAQRRGVGRALVAAFVRRFSPCADLLQVGTQVANAPSLALYQRLGFTVMHSTYVLHLHAGGPPA
jgi:ribosomal protein S18 acetylase RimI-like enzyme